MIYYGLHLIEVKEKQNIMMIFFTPPPKNWIFEEKKLDFYKDKKNVIWLDKKSPTKMTDFSKTFLSSQIGHFFQTFFLVDNILVNVHFDAGPSILMFTKKKWRNFINVRFLSQVLRNTNYSCGSTCRQRF